MFCGHCGTWSPEPSTTCLSCGAVLRAAGTGSLPGQPQASAPGVSHWPRQAFGGFWRRLGASLVDGLILYFPTAIAKVLLGLPLLSPSTGSDSGMALGVSLGSLLLTWLYSALMESSAAQGTLGQQLLGMRVMDMQARRITFARASGRYFGQFLSLLMGGVGYLFNLWTSRRQTVHDLLAGCVVVIAERAPIAAPAQSGELA